VTGCGRPNGSGNALDPVITAGRLPLLVIVIVFVACLPSGTEPKSSDEVPVSVGTMSATDCPDSAITVWVWTVRSSPVNVSESVSVPAADGW